MSILTSEQRRVLEDACIHGRRAAEQAAKAAITVLAVDAEGLADHLSVTDRDLQQGLRAKAQQLGDAGDDLALLVADCAYEQWHRLLFARFLAENGLLIHPELGAPLTLGDCEELANELEEPDGWAVAARFAAEILPGIFRLDDPCVRIRLAPEGRLQLEGIVSGLPAELFLADDALGWVYQFWQKEKKDEVNRSERKIEGADLGPVTQLFTENYMVRFLLQNSLGAWWAAQHPASPIVKDWEYLRFDSGARPAAGSFDEWPSSVAAVTVIDPCCGSGHFLVEAFTMLWQMRAEEEGLTPADAQDAVLRDNLFGLELDARCVQIAMFAVALQAWKSGGGWRELPIPNIGCSGIPVTAPVEEWKTLANGDARLESALARLHTLFRYADTLGSLIEPRDAAESSDLSGLQSSLYDVDWDDVVPLLQTAASSEGADPAAAVLGAAASSLAKTAQLLTRRYVLVVTNVPYLSRTKQAAELRTHADGRYPRSKHDLATMMLERLLRLAEPTVFAVLPQGWTQLSRYRSLREEILANKTLRSCTFLGPGAFTAISGEVVNAILIMLDAQAPTQDASWFAIDVADKRGPDMKARALLNAEVLRHGQDDTAANPDARIVPQVLESGPLLAEYAHSLYGLRTGDGARLIRKFWELDPVSADWRRHQSTTVATRPYTGREHILHWEEGHGALAGLAAEGIASLQGEGAWGRPGIVVSLMGDLPATLYTGESFDNNCAVVWPVNQDHLPALWAFVKDTSFAESVRRIDRSLKVTNQTLLKVPFDLNHWQTVAGQPGGLLPSPESDDPTQWLFDGRPEVSKAPLQVAVGRLLGYRWPDQGEQDGLDELADDDGIVCLSSVRGERPAAERLRELLAYSFSGTWTPARSQELIARSGSTKKNLDSWLRDDFFKAHCRMFHNRPFLWHVWDGRKDGFGAVLNYHRLDRPTLEKLAYSYLGDWIERQASAARDDSPQAEERLAAAQDLRRRLELILHGEPPYDIYVRWKPLSEQPIGWDPDMNDGVRLNIRPFVEAGVLRARINMNWNKDRGRNPNGSERRNDLHLTQAQKSAANQSET